ncbi:hypothetical protein RQN30_11215 [Arcanobacterium hippocoleae]
MIQVEANESLRNVAKNSLVGIKLLNDSVFFGINGAGKTTVCEVLSRAATLKDDREDNSEPVRVYAFDDQWRKNKVGDFVEGGSAEGVTTVRLSEGARDLEEAIRVAQAELESARIDLTEKDKRKKLLKRVWMK